MKPFAERNLTVIGVIGMVATAGIVLAALEYQKLPIFTAYKARVFRLLRRIQRAGFRCAGAGVGFPGRRGDRS